MGAGPGSNHVEYPRGNVQERGNSSGQAHQPETGEKENSVQRFPPLGPANWPRYANLPLTYHPVPDIA